MAAPNPRKAEADALYRQKKYGEAATAYSAALKLEPSNEKIHSNRAACCEQLCKTLWGSEKRGWLECGLGDARKCQQLAPEWPKAHARVAAACAQKWLHEKDCAWERDDYDEEAAARSISKSAGPNTTCFSRSCKQECASLKREAEDACRRGLALDSADGYLRAALNKLRDDGEYEVRHVHAYPGGKYATDAALQRKEPAERLKGKGNELFAEKKYAHAEKAYNDALAFDALDAVLYSNRSACRSHQLDFKGALRDAEKTVRLNPAWAKGFLRLANALFGLGDYPGSEAACDQGLELDENHSALAKLKVRLHVETKEPLEVQREMHRLREDQRHRGSLKATLKGLKDHGGGAGPDISQGIEEMMGQMGLPPGIAGMAGLDMANMAQLPKVAADQPQMSEREMRNRARHAAGIRPPPAPDGAVEVGHDGGFNL